MKFLDLFSGIGGFRLGMEMAGHECVGHCEIDKFANASYIAMHKPKEDEWFADDITRVRAADIPGADCWCFGFPCQDISVAGKQGGFTSGKRSSLFFTVTGLIRDLEEKDRPSILFIENVKNLLSINRGFDFAKLLIELDEIGYDAEWQVLNSKNFGVPQNRERVFIIGHLRGRGGQKVFPVGGTDGETDIPIKIVAHRKGYRRNMQTFSPDGITETLSTCDGGGRGHYVILQKSRGNNEGGIKDICPTITKNAWEHNNFVVGGLYTNVSKDFNRGVLPGCSRCLKGNKHDAGVEFIDLNISGKVTENARALQARYNKGISNHKGECSGVYDGARIRRLTPRECFRLQGFPDEYFDRAREVNSDSQLYKQAGNSVTVNVIYEIAKRLEETNEHSGETNT